MSPSTSGQAGSRRAIEAALIEKCWKDPEFKAAVIADPKAEFERYTGKKLPAEVSIFIHEEDANTVHFSIPPAPANIGELSDEELAKVAGGTDVVLTAVLVTVLASVVGASAAVKVSSVKW